VIFAMHRAYHATHNHDDAQDMRNMGGLRRYMPVTFILMWIATLAIAGIPVFAGFFSKDEILGAVFARAHESTLAQTSWLGIPGSTLLYVIYVMGLSAALLTAIYMTRMMLYTFHGPNRSGEKEQSHLAEAPWIMTGPLVVLGVLSVFGGWLNLPALLPLGPVGALEHWLEPVVGQSTALTSGGPHEAAHSTEWALIGAAVAIAVVGILIAVTRLKPEKLVPKAQAPDEQGFERVLREKYYVDEAYDKVVVQPTVWASRNVLAKGIDQGIIDKLLVTWIGTGIPRLLGNLGSWLQAGRVGTYAWVLLIGVIAVLGAFTLR
jgi:NADH-quinone oxidoreductase subunit L